MYVDATKSNYEFEDVSWNPPVIFSHLFNFFVNTTSLVHKSVGVEERK